MVRLVECFDQDRTHVKDLLKNFCLTKHNGHITRLNYGQTEEVLEQVERIVDSTIDAEQLEGKALFAELRWKRETGYYPQVFCLEKYLQEEKEQDIRLISMWGVNFASHRRKVGLPAR